MRGLEGLCSEPAGEWMRAAPGAPGIERVEAGFARTGFAPHRHDAYALGFTLRGVQAFRYRGAARHCLPGQVFAIHPDESHDGRPGSADGFQFRTLYLDPSLIQDALDRPGAALPFVRDVVSRNPRLAKALQPALADLDAPLDDLARDALIAEVTDALAAAAELPRPAPRVDAARMDRARALLDAAVPGTVSSHAMEAATGLSRYALARMFRARFGTSPHRYLVLRRVAHARTRIAAGDSLADAAAAAGFADQSHLTRHFKASYGLTPGRYAALLGGIHPTK